jgi:uncharacterized protein
MNPRLLRILNNRAEKYPHALEQQFPRVLNNILKLWGTPEIHACFADLMVDARGNRAGFPQKVASEIFYLSTLVGQHPEAASDDPWSDVTDEIKEGGKHEAPEKAIDFSSTGLLKASEIGNARIVSIILKSGLDVETCDERLWTPLIISASNGHAELAELLIKNGANIHHKDGAGYTALHWAAFNGSVQTVQLLLKEHADVNARSNHGWTALLQAATRGHLSVASTLIDNRADVNAASSDGWTPLAKAAANGYLSMVMLLLIKGADTSIKSSDGATALDIARTNKHEKIVAALSRNR